MPTERLHLPTGNGLWKDETLEAINDCDRHTHTHTHTENTKTIPMQAAHTYTHTTSTNHCEYWGGWDVRCREQDIGCAV